MRLSFGVPDTPDEKEHELGEVERNAMDPLGAYARDPVEKRKAENDNCPKNHRDLRRVVSARIHTYM